jgi:cytochrome bd-type quinol oxidase subunit 2
VPNDPITLSEAAADLATGFYGDLDASDILLEYAPILQPPYVVAGVGLAIGVLCGLTFAKLVQNRLEGWKQDRLALLPLGNVAITLPYIGVVIGVTLFIGGSLQVFGFSSGVALLVSFVLSVGTAGALWVQLERLMGQVQDGTFSAVDFDNFDQFF